MADIPGSKDRSLETLDFIINVLKEHEVNLDKTINELSTVVEQIGGTMGGLKEKVEESEEKINNLQREVANLIGYLSNATPITSPVTVKQQEMSIQAAPAVSSTAIQEQHILILNLTKWNDFQNLAMHAKRVSFNYKEDEKVFQATALVGNQLITYAGVLPDFSAVLKKWLSLKLDIDEKSILEGSLDKV